MNILVENTSIMKKLLTLLLLTIGFGTFAQETYEDLLILKADKNWEKLIKQGIKYTEKDDTKNDAEPYYYVALAYYNISFISDRGEEYENAFKDALSYIGKFMRKDKDGTVFEKHREFFSEVKQYLVEMIANEIEVGSYRGAFAWVIKMYKFDREEIGANYLEGAIRYHRGDKTTARNKWKEADELLANIESTDSWLKEDFDMLRIGIVETAKIYVQMRQNAKAKELMDKIAPWYEDDQIFQDQYDEIVNS